VAADLDIGQFSVGRGKNAQITSSATVHFAFCILQSPHLHLHGWCHKLARGDVIDIDIAVVEHY